MDAILDAFESIISALDRIGNQISTAINGTGQMIEMIADFRANFQSYLAWIPDSVYMVIYFGFGICCLYIILGRT